MSLRCMLHTCMYVLELTHNFWRHQFKTANYSNQSLRCHSCYGSVKVCWCDVLISRSAFKRMKKYFLTEHSNICHTSPRHLFENPSNLFQWRVLCSARSYFKRKIIEELITQQKSPTLNKQINYCYVVHLSIKTTLNHGRLLILMITIVENVKKRSVLLGTCLYMYMY